MQTAGLSERSVSEWLTHAGVAINVQLVARSAGALERAQSVDANVITGLVQSSTLIHICRIRDIWTTVLPQHNAM